MTTDHLTHAVTALERRDAMLGIGHALVAIAQTLRDAPVRPAAAPESPEPITDEPAVGDQVTDSAGDVWQHFEDGWNWWTGDVEGWSSCHRTRDYVQIHFGPVRATTDDDRRRVGLPVHDEDASPEPVEPAETDAQLEDVSEDPEPENGRENGVQGRIGWLQIAPGDEYLYLVREVPGGWADSDHSDPPFWPAKYWPDAEFTPIRTLADDEVAVKRGDLREVLNVTEIVFGCRSTPAATRLRAVLEAGR